MKNKNDAKDKKKKINKKRKLETDEKRSNYDGSDDAKGSCDVDTKGVETTNMNKKKHKCSQSRRRSRSLSTDSIGSKDSGAASKKAKVVKVPLPPSVSPSPTLHVAQSKQQDDIPDPKPFFLDSKKINGTKTRNDQNVKAKQTPKTTEPHSADVTCSYQLEAGGRPLVESSAFASGGSEGDNNSSGGVTLLLFYQYVEPMFTEIEYKKVLRQTEQIGLDCQVSGRMRVAKEGFNCTLTSSSRQYMYNFCRALRQWKPTIFLQTEFKLTHDLPMKQRFPFLKIIPVDEIVNYGLAGDRAPAITQYSGIHLEPVEYHKKLAEPGTVIIDVRNHYEALIGRFDPPTSATTTTDGSMDDNVNLKRSSEVGCDGMSITKSSNALPPPQWIDPKMRKSTEFPAWLDDPKTKEQLRGKQVLMYCTGGIRCERASALLQYRIQNDDEMKSLDIKGVYQLQGGIDKYFKDFPDGGYWKGKNYVFDKRFAHAPPEKMGQGRVLSSMADISEDTMNQSTADSNTNPCNNSETEPLGKCEACRKPWDMYRGKRRCPTCGVPSLICKECWHADQDGTRKIDKSIRCDLCVEQGIRSKKQLNHKIQNEIEQYERKSFEKGLLLPPKIDGPTHNADSKCDKGKDNNCVQINKYKQLNPYSSIVSSTTCTRLYLKNMCRKKMTEEVLLETFPGITHIVWRTDRTSGMFLGSGWVEMDTCTNASNAVSRSGEYVLGRPLYIEYQPHDPKDAWPPKNSAVMS